MPSVLVIDDDDQVRSVLREILESAGYIVDEAPDGARGIKRYRLAQHDLVLCDLFMPGKEGLETIRELRRESPRAKVIAISGGTRLIPSADFLRVAQDFGAVTALSKPISREALLRAVRRVLCGTGTDSKSD